MVDSSHVATSLLTEHLQYTPLSLVDDIINSVNNLVYQGVSSLENGLTSTPPDRLGFRPAPITTTSNSDDVQIPEYPEAKKEIEEGLHQLETLLESTVDKNFDKFEILVLRNVLCVPEGLEPWVRLKHYEDLPGQSSASSTYAPTVESLNLTRRKLAESQRLHRSLQAETLSNEAVIKQLRDLLQGTKAAHNKQHNTTSMEAKAAPDFSFLLSMPSITQFNIGAKSSESTLTTNTKFALSQLPPLRSLLTDLRTKLVTMRRTGPRVQSAADERREERKQYIEQRAMLHVDRDGDTNMLDHDVVKGKKIDPEEIAALEKVAGIFESS
ncbi:MAG: hypothetical protein Q9160_007028 [Pyrenula sp. 1 TL-2023]